MPSPNPGIGLQRLAARVRPLLPATAYRFCVRLARTSLAWRHRGNLSRLAMLYGTDKWGEHWYTQHYQRYLAPRRRERLNLLEIGIGGYDNPLEGARSLRMWKAYFRRANIVGIDLYDKTALREARIDIRQMDQTDASGLTRLSEEYGGFDLVVDDGSHLNHHVIQTFEILFPLLRPGGLYAIEDTQTSYWPTWGGGMHHPDSATSYFQRLSDGLNHAEYPIAAHKPTYFDTHITSIAFFHNLIFITQGDNTAVTNLPRERSRQIEAGAARSAAEAACRNPTR